MIFDGGFVSWLIFTTKNYKLKGASILRARPKTAPKRYRVTAGVAGGINDILLLIDELDRKNNENKMLMLHHA